MLENMEHRGATRLAEDTGDGSVILIKIPHKYLKEECKKQRCAPAVWRLCKRPDLFPSTEPERQQRREILLVGYRDV